MDIPERNNYYCLHQVSKSGLLPQIIETDADHSTAEAGKARLFSTRSIPINITTKYTGEAIQSYYNPITLLLDREI